MQDKKKLIEKMVSVKTPNFSQRPVKNDTFDINSSRILHTGPRGLKTTTNYRKRARSAFHTTKSKMHGPTHSKSSALVWLLVLVVVVVVIIGILAFVNHNNIKHGNTKDEKCTTNKNCAKGHFCSGDKTCQVGANGKDVGQTCTSSKECEVDLGCNGGKCQLLTN